MPDDSLEKLAVIMTVICVRNTCIENYHAAGKLTDPEMKEFNKEVADRIYTFLELLLIRPEKEQQEFMNRMGFLASGEIRTWDKPKFVTGMWSDKREGGKFDPRFTPNQGRYLAFIHQFTVIHGIAPAESDMQDYFRVSAPAVHQMVLALEKKGLIQRTPGQARAVKVLLPPEDLPRLP